MESLNDGKYAMRQLIYHKLFHVPAELWFQEEQH